MLNIDQCFVHNGKKLMGSTANRVLRLGPWYTVGLPSLNPFLRAVHQSEHGIKWTDTNRSGYRAQDFPSVARVVSPRARRRLARWGVETRNANVKGLVIWLELIWTYLNIFMSKTLALDARVEAAGYVVTFLVMWRLWVEWFVKQPGGPSTVDEAFITREAYTDVVMSCHFVVLLIVVFGEEGQSRPIPFRRLGTDVCEDLFSMLGGFVHNKRTYTVLEGLQTIRTMHRAEEVGGIRPASEGSTAGRGGTMGGGSRQGGRPDRLADRGANQGRLDGGHQESPTGVEVPAAW